MSFRVFGADIQGRDCGEEVSRWLTRYLAAGKTFRMVHYEPQMKPRKCAKIESPFPADEEVGSANHKRLNLIIYNPFVVISDSNMTPTVTVLQNYSLRTHNLCLLSLFSLFKKKEVQLISIHTKPNDLYWYDYI